MDEKMMAQLLEALEAGAYDAAPDPHGLRQGTGPCPDCIAEQEKADTERKKADELLKRMESERDPR